MARHRNRLALDPLLHSDKADNVLGKPWFWQRMVNLDDSSWAACPLKLCHGRSQRDTGQQFRGRHSTWASHNETPDIIFCLESGFLGSSLLFSVLLPLRMTWGRSQAWVTYFWHTILGCWGRGSWEHYCLHYYIQGMALAFLLVLPSQKKTVCNLW